MTTLVAKGVQFRSLIDQLSKQEFQQFMATMFDRNKHHMIATSLFNHLIHNNDELSNINSILSNIIQSRKIKPEPLPTTTIHLDKLPKSLIGHISCFLQQTDYFKLEKTNRSIFVGCNAPNMLKKLDLFKITDYSSINLHQFRSLKQLKINMTKFSQFKLPENEQCVINELEELSLNAKYKKDFDVETFLNQNSMNSSNIKTLKLGCFGDVGDGNRFNIDTFWKILGKFPNIECLELLDVFVTASIDADELKKLYPDLKGLTVRGGNNMTNNRIVNVFGNNLKFLFHSYAPCNSLNLSGVDFSKLEEIRLGTPNIKTINEILTTCSNLEKFGLYPDGYRLTSMSEQELKIAIPQILKCETLQYFVIDTNERNCMSILEGIEIGLYETKKRERMQIKIKVNATKNSRIDPNNMMFSVGRIIRWITPSKIKDFMFIWDLRKMDHQFAQKLDEEKVLKDLVDISPNIEVKASGLCFVITNKNCKINGWKESWIMTMHS